MRDLNQLIEDAYALFAPYTVGRTLDVCPCCVSEEEQQALLAVPLRQVPSDLLWRSYYESARNYSEQERWEMKHFLPRVLELLCAFDFPCHSPEITLARLDLDQPEHWPLAERQLLDEFALAFFHDCLRRYPLPDREPLATVLVLFGLAHFQLAPLLHAWQTSDTPASLRHFCYFLLNDLYMPLRGPVEFVDAFSTTYVNKQLAVWLSEPAARAHWEARLEHAVLHGSPADDQDSEASAAYEVLTRRLP